MMIKFFLSASQVSSVVRRCQRLSRWLLLLSILGMVSCGGGTSGSDNRPVESPTDDNTNFIDVALDLLEQEKYQQAIAEFDRAIAADKANADGYFGRGQAYSYLEDYESAFQDFSKAIENSPRVPSFYFWRGETYRQLGNCAAAIKDFDEAIGVDVNDTVVPIAYSSRAAAKSCINDHASAVGDASKAIELDPSFAKAYGNRAYAYRFLGEFEKAIADLNRAIELDPNDGRLYASRGMTYFAMKQNEQALADLQKARELAPLEATVYSQRATVYVELGQFEQAVADLSKAIDLGEATAMNFALRGLLYYRMLGEVEKAKTDFLHAVALGLDPERQTSVEKMLSELESKGK